MIIWPQKVNLTFHTVPEGLTLNVNGIPTVTPFVHDELIGFNDIVEAPQPDLGATNYTFGSWSDGGAQQHTIVVPSTDQNYTATYTAPVAAPALRPGGGSTPQTPQTTVCDRVPAAQRRRRPERGRDRSGQRHLEHRRP